MVNKNYVIAQIYLSCHEQLKKYESFSMVSLLSCRHLAAVQSQVDNCTGLSKVFTSHWVGRPRMCKRWIVLPNRKISTQEITQLPFL